MLIINGLVFIMWLGFGSNPMLSGVMQDYFLLHKAPVFFDIVSSNQGGEQAYYAVKDGIALGRLQSDFKPVGVVTWMFSHYEFMHLFWNMLILLFLGPAVEAVMGTKRFLAFYLYVGVMAGILVAVLEPLTGGYGPVLGASGAVYGVMVAFVAMFPNRDLQLLLLPFRIRASLIVFLMYIYSGYMVFNPDPTSRVSHFGHFMGLLAAIGYFIVRPPRSFVKHD